LKYGVVVAVAQVTLVATAARSRLGAPAEIMQLKPSTLLRGGNILFVQEALGPVLNRTPVMREWDAVHM
jgi:hypothetical protein